MLIGFTCSTFDLLHAGHVKMLEYAAQHCDSLWVGLQTQVPDRPEKNAPIQTVYERYIQLECLKRVHKIIPYESEDDLINLLVTLPIPHIRFVGYEYVDKYFTGKNLYNDPLTGGPELLTDRKLMYTPREHSWSSTNLRQRVAKAERIKEGNIADVVKAKE